MSIRRRFPGILAVLVALPLVLSGCFLPAPNVTPGAGEPDVQDFEFESLTIDYELGVDADGVSTLTTTERFVAVFPEYDQNRGMVRYLPERFDGRDTELEVVAVTDGDSTAIDYEIEEYDTGIGVVMAVPEGEYVHGEQTYELTYEQSGVVRSTEGGPEFSWEALDTTWGQPFGNVAVELTLAPALADAVTATGCWVGRQGSTETCEFSAAGGTYSAASGPLRANEGLTILLAFEVGTFTD